MGYKKPEIIETQDNLPPVTVNFAPPAVGTSEGISASREELSKVIEKKFNITPDFNDKRISESAKQI